MPKAGPPRVLLVEDNSRLRRAFAGYLRGEGFEVDEAGDGQQCLAQMHQVLPDVVVLDLVMPVMDGRAFAEACKSDPRLAPVPLVVLSGADELSQAVESVGARAGLAKPIDLDVLAAVVQRIVAA